MKANKQIMGENIQRYLDEKGMTRKELAEALGFPYSSVTDWINGKTYPRIDKIEMMANFFGIQKSDLVEQKAEEISQEDRKLLASFHALNDTGRRKAAEYITDLLDNPRYTEERSFSSEVG